MGLITGPLGRRARKHFAGLDVLLEEQGANSLGVESMGRGQVRGNGNLALTADELIFAQWIPNRVMRLPRASILEATTAESHLGKRVGRPLLKLVWTNERAETDSIALVVRDLDGWIDALTG